MIVRITRASIKANHEATVFQILREASAATPRPDGLEAMLISRRMGDGSDELVAITIWRDIDVLIATMGEGWHAPSFLPRLDPMLIEPSVEHYETIAENWDELQKLGA